MIRSRTETRVSDANANKVKGPATHPSWEILHDSDSTPEPITAVIICARALHIVPVGVIVLNHSIQVVFILTNSICMIKV